MTAEEIAELLKAVNANRPQVTQTLNFNASVGQQIAHVDKIEAHFDKDMSMQVAHAEKREHSNGYEGADHFPLVATTDKLLVLYESLVANNFITKETSSEEFLYYFGHVEYKTTQQKRIIWIANKSNKQLLRELVIGMYKPMIDLGKITKACIEKIVPSVFVDFKGEPVSLAKEKKVPSCESDKIEKFLATFHK